MDITISAILVYIQLMSQILEKWHLYHWFTCKLL